MHNNENERSLTFFSTKIKSIYICTCGRIPSFHLAYKDETFYVLTKCNCENNQQFKLSKFINEYEHTLNKQQSLNNKDNTIIYFCMNCNFILNNNFAYKNSNDVSLSTIKNWFLAQKVLMIADSCQCFVNLSCIAASNSILNG